MSYLEMEQPENNKTEEPQIIKLAEVDEAEDQSSSGHSRSEDDAEETYPSIENGKVKVDDKSQDEAPTGSDPEQEQKEEEEESEQEDENDNPVEAKDFMYFKRQKKFEKFVSQLGKNKQSFGALEGFIGGEVCEDEKEETKLEKEIVGFDTRFRYTREGLMVYDVYSQITLDARRDENKGISAKEYNFFCNFLPSNSHDDEEKHHCYSKFKSYSNALAPFAGLEFATELERRIYEFLPPFKRKKEHPKVKELLIPNTENVLFFNSEFESGNLEKAIRISDFEYNLYLEFDKNSRNHTQWYYFACRNVKKGITVKFNIINLLKVDS